MKNDNKVSIDFGGFYESIHMDNVDSLIDSYNSDGEYPEYNFDKVNFDSLKLILDWGAIKKNEAEILDLAALKNNWYLEMVASMQADEILPSVRDFIQSLKSDNIKIGLGSASKNSEAILKKINLLDQFDVIIDGNKVSQSKPSPEVFLKGAAALEILPKNCLVFEDALSGVEAAINAGMRVVGIGESKILCNADLVVSGFQELSLDRLKTYFTAIDK